MTIVAFANKQMSEMSVTYGLYHVNSLHGVKNQCTGGQILICDS